MYRRRQGSNGGAVVTIRGSCGLEIDKQGDEERGHGLALYLSRYLLTSFRRKSRWGGTCRTLLWTHSTGVPSDDSTNAGAEGWVRPKPRPVNLRKRERRRMTGPIDGRQIKYREYSMYCTDYGPEMHCTMSHIRCPKGTFFFVPQSSFGPLQGSMFLSSRER